MKNAQSRHRKLSSNFINKLQIKYSHSDLSNSAKSDHMTSTKSLNETPHTNYLPFLSEENLRSHSVVSIYGNNLNLSRSRTKKHKLSKSERPLTFGGYSDLRASMEVYQYRDEIKDFLTGTMPSSRRGSRYVVQDDVISVGEYENENSDDIQDVIIEEEVNNKGKRRKKNKRSSKTGCVIL